MHQITRWQRARCAALFAKLIDLFFEVQPGRVKELGEQPARERFAQLVPAFASLESELQAVRTSLPAGDEAS